MYVFLGMVPPFFEMDNKKAQFDPSEVRVMLKKKQQGETRTVKRETPVPVVKTVKRKRSEDSPDFDTEGISRSSSIQSSTGSTGNRGKRGPKLSVAKKSRKSPSGEPPVITIEDDNVNETEKDDEDVNSKDVKREDGNVYCR